MPWPLIEAAIAGTSPECTIHAHYQPIKRLEELEEDPRFFEALARVELGSVPVDNGMLFPVLGKHHGTLAKLDWWMLREVARQIQSDSGIRRYAVNVSAHTLDNPSFPNELTRLFNGLAPAKNLVLELTEREHLTELALQIIRQISDYCCLHIDDLGEGHSSLGLLLDTRPCGVKFGQKLMQSIATDARKQSLVRKLCEYAIEWNLMAIAEYVEDEMAIEWLRGLKSETPALDLWCQGWGVGR